MKTYSAIVGCNFFQNSALYSAGAIKFAEAGAVLLKNNNFTENSVADPSYRFSDGGAIYYGCNPSTISEDEECNVTLDSNVFQGNTAQNKGGAMRYINRNFTTTFIERETGRRMLFDGVEHG